MKKILYSIAAIILAIVCVIAGWRWYQGGFGLPGQDDLSDLADRENPFIQYSNDRYGYSLKFPSTWLIGFAGESKEQALGIWLVSDERDLQVSDGGLPLGAKVEVFVQELGELKEVDANFPEITSIQDWIAWQDTNQQSYDMEVKGPPVRTDETVAGQPAVLSVYEHPEFPEVGTSRIVQCLSSDASRVFMMQYTGREPDYTANVGRFQGIVESFGFVSD